MSARLASGLIVSALIRKAEHGGGTGMVLARGDETSGALLIVLAERGRTIGLRERGYRSDGSRGWMPSGPAHPDEPGVVSDYVARRRRSDPDLWVVELDGDPPAIEALLELV